jgi:hypothetical protein
VRGHRARPFNGNLDEIGGTCELHGEDENFVGNNILADRSGANRSLARPRRRRDDDIKIDLKRKNCI